MCYTEQQISQINNGIYLQNAVPYKTYYNIIDLQQCDTFILFLNTDGILVKLFDGVEEIIMDNVSYFYFSSGYTPIYYIVDNDNNFYTNTLFMGYSFDKIDIDLFRFKDYVNVKYFDTYLLQDYHMFTLSLYQDGSLFRKNTKIAENVEMAMGIFNGIAFIYKNDLKTLHVIVDDIQNDYSFNSEIIKIKSYNINDMEDYNQYDDNSKTLFVLLIMDKERTLWVLDMTKDGHGFSSILDINDLKDNITEISKNVQDFDMSPSRLLLTNRF